MATDKAGNTIAIGDLYGVAGIVRKVDSPASGRCLVVVGDEPIHVDAADLVQLAPPPNPFCATGTGTNLTTTEATMNLSTVRVSNGRYSLASNEVTVTYGGVYWVSFVVQGTIDGTTGATRAALEAKVQDDAVDIPQSINSTYLRELADSAGVSNGFPVPLGAGSKLRLRGVLSDTVDASLFRSQLSIMQVGF